MLVYQDKHKGYTLIEILIAITVGLLVVSVASVVLQRTISDNLKIKDSAMLRESVFFTSHLVEQHLRQAGYKDIDNSLVSSRRMPIRRNDEMFPAVASSWSEGQILKADANAISIRFSGSSDNAGVPDGSIIDCGGNAIGAGIVSDITLSLTNGQLICSSGGVQQTLLGSDATLDVDEFKITLGIDDGNDGSIDRYVDSASATNADFLDTREIVLVMLLVSNQPLDAMGETYTFEDSEIDYPDNFYRRELVIRTSLRNTTVVS